MAKLLDFKSGDPWWVILLKVIAYAIGLIIGGIGTMASAQLIGITGEPSTEVHHRIEMHASTTNNTNGQSVCNWPQVSTTNLQTQPK